MPNDNVDRRDGRRLLKPTRSLEFQSRYATMFVLAASNDTQSPLARIRMADPLHRLLAGSGGGWRLESYPYLRFADLAQADVFVAQRGLYTRHLRLMQAMRARGGAVIYEIDDLLIESAPHLLFHSTLKQARPCILQCLAEAHLVTTSTQRLAAALAPYAQHIQLVPNSAQAPPDSWETLPVAQAGQPATVLLASSDSLASTALYPALRELVSERGAGLQLVGIGRAGDDAAAAGLPVQRQPLMPREAFLAFARKLPNVVAAIPLDDSPFSACKSAIKWFDYAQAGIPTLAADLPPYADVIDNSQTGVLVADRVDAWHQALAHALDNPAWRSAIAHHARERVRTHHHPASTDAAWAVALARAMALRAQSTPARDKPTWWAGWRGRMTDPVDSLVVSLRRLNRLRLAQRRDRTAGRKVAA